MTASGDSELLLSGISAALFSCKIDEVMPYFIIYKLF
jgi:hypothetical protein